MPFRKFRKWLADYDWTVAKGGIDWNVLDESGYLVCSIIRHHPGEDVVVAHSVKKVERKLPKRGKL